MATYKFVCPLCGNKVDITMPISEYKRDGHFCEDCGAELSRDMSDFCTSSKRQIPGFYGVEKNK